MHRFAAAFILSATLLSGCVHYEGERLRQVVAVEHGRQVAQARCGSCHGIGVTGDSPAPEAPPFRTLSQSNFRVATLETALTQGISTGHPAMPEMQLSQKDVRDLVAYLQSVQSHS